MTSAPTALARPFSQAPDPYEWGVESNSVSAKPIAVARHDLAADRTIAQVVFGSALDCVALACGVRNLVSKVLLTQFGDFDSRALALIPASG